MNRIAKFFRTYNELWLGPIGFVVWVAHVGFIDAWPDGDYVITVEGNTNMAGSREGDGVYRKRRPKQSIYQVSRWV